MFKLLIPIATLALLAACARSTVPTVGGYVPRDGNGRPVMAEIGKRF